MRIKVLALALGALLLPSRLVGENVKLSVKVVEGRKGHPWPGKTVFILDERKSVGSIVAEGKTGRDGVAVFSLDQAAIIFVVVPNAPSCSSKNLWTVAELSQSGAVPDDLCNNKVTNVLTPGALVFYVRHETLREILDMD